MLYLFHFSEPLGDPTRPNMSAQHYLGFATNEHSLTERVKHHRKGTAQVAITAAAIARGIELQLVRVWQGTRDDERRLKRAGHFADRLCEICMTTDNQQGRYR